MSRIKLLGKLINLIGSHRGGHFDWPKLTLIEKITVMEIRRYIQGEHNEK